MLLGTGVALGGEHRRAKHGGRRAADADGDQEAVGEVMDNHEAECTILCGQG